MRVQTMRPVDVRVQTQSVGNIDKTEQVLAVCANALEIEGPVNLVTFANRLVHSRLKNVLVAAVENRNLKVIERIAGDVRQRIQFEQRRGLRTDWHLIVRERLPRRWVDNRRRLSLRACKIAGPLVECWNQCGLGQRRVIARPLISDEEI